MKKRKTTPVVRKIKKKKSVKRVSKKAMLRRKRPIHKRIMLHPATIFMLLCVGVFLSAWTFRTFAQNITVTASIFAPLPSSAATITYPVSDVHFTVSTLTIKGICPSDSYVELYRNNAFSGLANCGPGVTNYEIVTDLSLGSNVLYTKVFNVTDNEGPQSAHITVWRDQPASKPAAIPASTPTKLLVLTIENKSTNGFGTNYTSPYPTITGTAIPLSYVVLTYQTTPRICSTYADSVGNWSCSLSDKLTEGTHQVNISSKAASGSVSNYPTFQIITSQSISPLQKPNSTTKAFTLNYNYQYQVYTSGKSAEWNISINGGNAPYAMTILWGDGETSTLVRTNNDSFVISHTYKLFKILSSTYTINIKAVDTKDAVANLQLSALVTFNGARPGGAVASLTDSSVYSSMTRFVKKWVWLVWPAYAVVLLMTTSFWLGEREEYVKLKHFKRLKHRRV